MNELFPFKGSRMGPKRILISNVGLSRESYMKYTTKPYTLSHIPQSKKKLLGAGVESRCKIEDFPDTESETRRCHTN